MPHEGDTRVSGSNMGPAVGFPAPTHINVGFQPHPNAKPKTYRVPFRPGTTTILPDGMGLVVDEESTMTPEMWHRLTSRPEPAEWPPLDYLDTLNLGKVHP